MHIPFMVTRTFNATPTEKVATSIRFNFYVKNRVSIKPNCTLLVHYGHVTRGVLIRYQISRSTGVPVATTKTKTRIEKTHRV